MVVELMGGGGGERGGGGGGIGITLRIAVIKNYMINLNRAVNNQALVF